MAIPHNPIRASRAILRSLDRSEVLVKEWPCACLPNQYFRIMDPELVIVMDQVRAHASLTQALGPSPNSDPATRTKSVHRFFHRGFAQRA